MLQTLKGEKVLNIRNTILGLFGLIFTAGISSLYLSESARSEVLPQPFVHPSAAAMGGAYTAVANDDSSPFTNPAGIARVKKARSRGSFQLLRSPQFFVGSNEIGSYSELGSLQGRHMLGAQGWDEDITHEYYQIGSFADGMPDIDTLDENLIEIFKENPSAAVWGRFDIGFLGVFEYAKNVPISLGLYLTSEGTLTPESASLTSADIDGTTLIRYTDVINIMPVIGTAFSDKSKRISFGLQVRPILRHSYDGSNQLSNYGNVDAIIPEIKSNSNEDTAIAYDMGFMWTLADFWYPTIGFAVFNMPTDCKSDYLNPYDQTVHEICGTNFESDTTINKNSLSNLDPTDIRAGFSIAPRLSRKLALRMSFDYHFIEYASGDSNYGLPEIPEVQKTHIGIEIFAGNPLELSGFRAKAGLNQGQLTIGGNLDFGFMQIDIASYGLDISVDDTPVADRRTLVSVSAGF